MATFKTEINVKNDADGYDILLPKTTYDMVRTDDGSKLSDVRINGKELKGEITIETTTEAPPINHASNTTQYGAGTSSQYGHVKLSDNYTSNSGGAGNSLGASQTALYNAYNSLNSKIADLSTGKFLPITGGTLTGDLRIKSGSNYGTKLNLGDGDYVHLYERTDDNLDIKAKTIDLLCTNLYQNGKPIGGGAGSKKNVTKYSQELSNIPVLQNNQNNGTRLNFYGNVLTGQSWVLSFRMDVSSIRDFEQFYVLGILPNLIDRVEFTWSNYFDTASTKSWYCRMGYFSLKDAFNGFDTSSGIVGIFYSNSSPFWVRGDYYSYSPSQCFFVTKETENQFNISSGINYVSAWKNISQPSFRFMNLTSYRYY